MLQRWPQDHQKATAIDHNPSATQSDIAGAPSRVIMAKQRFYHTKPGEIGESHRASADIDVQ
jgi:hypothetical protein